MHSPSCHGTFVVIRGGVLGVLLAGFSALASAVPRSQATSHFSPEKSARLHLFSPVSPRDMGGLS
jgi:hypothetical protein